MDFGSYFCIQDKFSDPCIWICNIGKSEEPGFLYVLTKDPDPEQKHPHIEILVNVGFGYNNTWVSRRIWISIYKEKSRSRSTKVLPQMQPVCIHSQINVHNVYGPPSPTDPFHANPPFGAHLETRQSIREVEINRSQ